MGSYEGAYEERTGVGTFPLRADSPVLPSVCVNSGDFGDLAECVGDCLGCCLGKECDSPNWLGKMEDPQSDYFPSKEVSPEMSS